MKLGITLRNMGPQSTPDVMMQCVKAAEGAGFESVWITDHIAIPPDDAEGSGGRYLDPLVTLAWMAALTTRIMLGTGVLILPYRPALPTAKQVAALQELARGRLLLGIGTGWMDAEFRALGVERSQRGRLADEALDLLRRCFANDVVEAHGQPFIFAPRPAPPPIYVGGRPPHALERAARYGDGWLPMGTAPADLARDLEDYRRITQALGRPEGRVTVMGGLPLRDRPAAIARLHEYRALGVERFVVGVRYADVDEYRTLVEQVAAVRDGLGT